MALLYAIKNGKLIDGWIRNVFNSIYEAIFFNYFWCSTVISQIDFSTFFPVN